MKILTISDLHGRTVWKNADFDLYDRIIFLGDYTDSYVEDDDTIYNNLQEIIQLKRRQSDKFTLLIGNHDAQYLHFPHYRCSGFRARMQPVLSALFTEHDNLFQIAHQEHNYLFTHAGLTNQWFRRLLVKTGKEELSTMPDYDLAGFLNELHRQPQPVRNLLFEVGPVRGGYDPFSGPVWADRSETLRDHLANFHQIVGHTPIDDFRTVGDQASSITYTDVLQTKTAFYERIIPD